MLYLYLHKIPSPAADHCHAFGYSYIATCVIKMHVFLSSLFVCLYVCISAFTAIFHFCSIQSCIRNTMNSKFLAIFVMIHDEFVIAKAAQSLAV